VSRVNSLLQFYFKARKMAEFRHFWRVRDMGMPSRETSVGAALRTSRRSVPRLEPAAPMLALTVCLPCAPRGKPWPTAALLPAGIATR
jgi:hypothetical protein